MAASSEPSSSDSPGIVKSCDASGMAMIHRMFRRAFGEAPDLVRGVRAGDVGHAGAVAGHVHLLSVGLHSHHEGEDERLWGALAERAPACALHVERMKAQHADMVVHLNLLDAALPVWRATANDPTPVLTALAGINHALGVHLPDEEASIVPVMERTLTQKEVDWFSAHGRKATPKGMLWPMLGILLSSQPDGGEQFLREELPAPLRLLWRWVGASKYEQYRATLVRA